jgi:hypothetical protein
MLDKNKTYLVLNYNGSPVAVSTRHESYIIPGGSSPALSPWMWSAFLTPSFSPITKPVALFQVILLYWSVSVSSSLIFISFCSACSEE